MRKALNPVFMLALRCLEVWCIHTTIVFLTIFLYKKIDLLFLVLFWGCFSFKALDLGDFRGISKNKKCGKGRGGCGGQQDFFMDLGGGIFGIFLELFLGFLQSVQRKLNFDNQKKLLLP